MHTHAHTDLHIVLDAVVDGLARVSVAIRVAKLLCTEREKKRCDAW